MPPYERIKAFRTPRSGYRRRWFSAALPWIFVLGVAAATTLPVRQWVRWLLPADLSLNPVDSQAARDAEMVWKRAGTGGVRHPVDVIRTIDGDTFEARVHLPPDLNLTTRVRLRGIDTPELKAACPQELKMAEAATAALRALLGEGDVRIFNIGPDKYSGPRRCRRRHAAQRRCFGRDDWHRSGPQLWRRTSQRLVRERKGAIG